MTDSAAAIRSFFHDRLGVAVEDDDDIFALGFVTSLFAVELVTFVESTFGFEVAPTDLVLDNFRSVNALWELVDRRRAA